MDQLGALADLAATTTPPPEVRAKAALVLADTIGAIAGGAAEAEVARLSERLLDRSDGHAPIIGPGGIADARTAALLNGTAGTALEMDEGHQFCKGHPAIHVIPAVLAEAAGKALSGPAVLDAIAVGYEVAARVGIAASLRPSMHPHGTWGAIGAAAAILRLRGAAAAEIRDGMNMAASLGLSTSRRTMLEGGTVRNVFAGVSNQMGLLTADLVAAGFSGDGEGVAHVFGNVVSDRFEASALAEALGERWEITRNYFKLHACCRFNHATLDALDLLIADAPAFAPGDIADITVNTYGLAVELDDAAPRNVLAAKFSVPFAVATRLVTGTTTVESFSAARVGDEAIRELAGRVRLLEDTAMSAMLPDQRPARTTVALKDGRGFTAAVETNRGDWANPYSEAELHDKYLSLTARPWPRQKAQAVWDAALGLDAGEAAAFLDLLAAPTD